MNMQEYGNQASKTVLIQPVDDHDLALIESEVAAIRETTDDFRLIAVKVNDWNKDLSPWDAPPVFGSERFGNGADGFLKEILPLCTDRSKIYFIGGYSLAGLFALWAAYQTDRFEGVAAASPSIWFPGFIEHMRAGKINADRVYLSLGNREAKTRNPVMATVADCIEISFDLLRKQGVESVLEWNEGNHFKDADIRTAKAFSWVLNGPGGRG
jgi:predicted alpha/beta superfamily hydrolase